MLNIRTSTGKLIPLPKDARFVEIGDDEGRVSHVIALKDSGELQIFTSDDKTEAKLYAQAFRVEFCKVIKLPESHLVSPLNSR